MPEQVEGDVAHADVARQEEVALVAPAQALLQVEERQPAVGGLGDEFAIEDDRGLQMGGGGEQFRELRADRFQVATEQLGPPGAGVQLGADAVELVLQPDAPACRVGGQFVGGILANQALPDRLGAFLRAGEHDLDGHEQARGRLLQPAGAGQHGGLTEVAGEHGGFAHGFRLLIEGGRHGLLDEALLRAHAQFAGEQAHQPGAADGIEPGQGVAQQRGLRRRPACGPQGAQKGVGAGQGQGGVPRRGGRARQAEDQKSGATGVGLRARNGAELGLAEAAQRLQGAAQHGPAGVQRRLAGGGIKMQAGEVAHRQRQVGVGQAAQVIGQQGGFFPARGLGGGGGGDRAPGGEPLRGLGGRRRVGWRGARQRCGSQAEQLQLVGLLQRPGLPAARTQVGGELAGRAVDEPHLARLHGLDGGEQFVVIGVIAEWENLVDLVAVACPRLQGPAAEQGGATGLQPAQGQAALGAGRADQDVTGSAGGVKELKVRQWTELGRQRLGHFEDRLVQHHRVTGTGEQAQDFLGLAEGVTEQDRDGAVLQGFAHPLQHAGDGLLAWRKPELRQAKGAFHDQGVRSRQFAGFGAEAVAQFEVAGVQQAGAIAAAGQVQQGRARDVTGRQQAQLPVLPGLGFPERQGLKLPLGAEARPHQLARDLRAEAQLVAGEVIGMGVRDEGALHAEARVQPQVRLRQVNAAAVANFDQRGHGDVRRLRPRRPPG